MLVSLLLAESVLGVVDSAAVAGMASRETCSRGPWE